MATAAQSTPELWQLYWADRSIEARNALAMNYIKYVQRLATNVRSRYPQSVELCDCFSDGFIGLLKAIDKFDPAQGVFETFAWSKIVGAILSGIRKRDPLPRRTRAAGQVHLGDVATSDETRLHHLSGRANREADPLEHLKVQDLIDRATKGMSERELTLLRLRYWDGQTLQSISETGAIGRITPEWVRGLHMRLMRKMRHRLKKAMAA